MSMSITSCGGPQQEESPLPTRRVVVHASRLDAPPAQHRDDITTAAIFLRSATSAARITSKSRSSAAPIMESSREPPARTTPLSARPALDGAGRPEEIAPPAQPRARSRRPPVHRPDLNRLRPPRSRPITLVDAVCTAICEISVPPRPRRPRTISPSTGASEPGPLRARLPLSARARGRNAGARGLPPRRRPPPPPLLELHPRRRVILAAPACNVPAVSRTSPRRSVGPPRKSVGPPREAVAPPRETVAPTRECGRPATEIARPAMEARRSAMATRRPATESARSSTEHGRSAAEVAACSTHDARLATAHGRSATAIEGSASRFEAPARNRAAPPWKPLAPPGSTPSDPAPRAPPRRRDEAPDRLRLAHLLDEPREHLLARPTPARAAGSASPQPSRLAPLQICTPARAISAPPLTRPRLAPRHASARTHRRHRRARFLLAWRARHDKR
jgi:hypothetical protein